MRMKYSVAIFLLLPIFNGCSEYQKLTNDPPTITSINVPSEVLFGDIVTFSVRAVDPNDDELTYLWNVSAGQLSSDSHLEVQWTAPELPTEVLTIPLSVTVDVYIDDGIGGNISRSLEVRVSSKEYNITNKFIGEYTLVRTLSEGEHVEKVGIMRLTSSTFIREFPDDGIFLSGLYRLIEPYDYSNGTIQWIADTGNNPIDSTYTWNGKQLVITFPNTSSQYVYLKTGTIDELIPVNTKHTDNEEPIIQGNEEPIISINDATFNEKVLKAELPVVVEFMADWCPFCLQMKPILEDVVSEQKGRFTIAKLYHLK